MVIQPSLAPWRAAAAITVIAAFALAGAGCGEKNEDAAGLPPVPVDQVPTTFPAAQGEPFAEPAELVANNGVLQETLTVQRTRFAVGGTEVVGRSYDGNFIGPTLVVAPGDRIELTIDNQLPEQTNIHFHGFHTSPSGIADNVLREIAPGKTGQVVVPVPETMTPGTYWYHSHAHPNSEGQVFSGLSGAIVVEGLAELLPPELRGVSDHLFALKDLQVDDGAIPTHDINSNAPTTRTVNGLIAPRVSIAPGETQLWRLANISADIWYRLDLEGASFTVIAEDANPVGSVWEEEKLLLPPGKRYDVLVQGPREGGEYPLRTLAYSTGPVGDDYPRRTMATLIVEGDAVDPALPPSGLAPEPHLEREHVDRERKFVFSEQSKANRFFINGKQFNHDVVNTEAELGTVEEWTITNTSEEQHPFHLHIDDFQVISINGEPYDANSLQDTVPLPVGGEVVIRVRFSEFTGRFVYHCHILAHEDAGMMGQIQVRADPDRRSHR